MPYGIHPFLWTDDDRNRVIAMLDAGKHFSDIAAEFHLTRNAVAGRVNRDQKLHEHVHCLPGKQGPKKSKPAKAKKENENKPLEPDRETPGEPFHVKPEPVRVKREPPHPMLLVPQMNLGMNQCKWPVIADYTVTGGHLFCGRPTAFGEVYCEAHKSMAHPKGRDDA
jgi:hypothetical protein